MAEGAPAADRQGARRRMSVSAGIFNSLQHALAADTQEEEGVSAYAFEDAARRDGTNNIFGTRLSQIGKDALNLPMSLLSGAMGNKVGAVDVEEGDREPASRRASSAPARSRRSTVGAVLNEDEVSLIKSLKVSQDRFMINPVGVFCKWWELLIDLVSIYLLLIVPWNVAFQPDMNSDCRGKRCYPSYLLGLDATAIALCWMDVFFNCRRGYINNQQQIVMRVHLSVARYISSGKLVIDILAALPLQFVNVELRVLQCTKAIRLWHALRRCDRMAQANLVVLCFLMLGLIVLGHWIGSIYFWLGYYQATKTETSCNVFTGCPWVSEPSFNGRTLLEADLPTQYSTSAYWGMTMLTSVEFGYVQPRTNTERYYACFTQLLGSVTTALVFGTVVNIVRDEQGSSARFRRLMDKVNNFIRFYQLPKEMAERLKSTIEYDYSLNAGISKDDVLRILPNGLRTAILVELYSKVLAKSPIFKSADVAFMQAMVGSIHAQSFMPGEVVFEEGWLGRDIYFVARGALHVSANGEFLRTFTTGDMFGQTGFFSDGRRTATVEAVTYCEVYIIYAEDLVTILEDFPQYEKLIEQGALASSNAVSQALRDIGTSRKRDGSSMPRVSSSDGLEKGAGMGGAKVLPEELAGGASSKGGDPGNWRRRYSTTSGSDVLPTLVTEMLAKQDEKLEKMMDVVTSLSSSVMDLKQSSL